MIGCLLILTIVIVIVLVILNRRDSFQNNRKYLFDISKELTPAKFNQLEVNKLCIGEDCFTEDDLRKLQQLAGYNSQLKKLESTGLSSNIIQRVSNNYANTFVIQRNMKKLTKNNLVGTTRITRNYRLSMEIMPNQKNSYWTSIIHFTTHDDTGKYNLKDHKMTRAPSIHISPNTLDLHVTIGNNVETNWVGCNTDTGNLTLKPKEWNTFKMEVINNRVKIYLNDILRCDKQLPGVTLEYPHIKVYLSNPWSAAADAFVRNVIYERNAK